MSVLSLRQPAVGGTGGFDSVSLVRPVLGSASSQEIAVVHLVAAPDLGSGGFQEVDWSRASARTGPFTIVREGGSAPEEPLATADRVLLVRRWFSLSVAEAARALHVQRPTIYSWQDGKTPAAPKNLERLRAVFELAREWRSMSPDPVGNQRKEPLAPGGQTLVDLLSADPIARPRVLATLRRIAEAQGRNRARRPTSGAELAKRFGFKPLPAADAAVNVARESARASHKTGDR